MKRVILAALCTATVEEAWRWDVPDDFPLYGTLDEIHERLMGEEESPPGVIFAGVEDVEVNDERDREWRSSSVEDWKPTDAQAPARYRALFTADELRVMLDALQFMEGANMADHFAESFDPAVDPKGTAEGYEAVRASAEKVVGDLLSIT